MSKPLSAEELSKELESLNGWSRDGDAIKREFKFADFREALAFIVRVGLEAEDVVHHPDLHNVYNTVTIRLQTHDAGNKVTAKDIELASRIDKLV